MQLWNKDNNAHILDIRKQMRQKIFCHKYVKLRTIFLRNKNKIFARNT